MINNKKEPIILFLGDMIIFTLSLWLVLFIRYSEIPNQEIFIQHIIPFSLLFVIWALTFFIAGLYEKRTLIIKRRLFANIFNTQVINSIIAVIFFYFTFIFQITPKTNLLIYIIVSFVLILIWRVYIAPSLGVRKRANAIIIGDKKEIWDIKNAINNNYWYNLNLITAIDLNKISGLDFNRDILDLILREEVSVIILDIGNKKIKSISHNLYNLMFSGIKFMEADEVYEDIFGRIPLSLIEHDWFLSNVSHTSHIFYDTLKRVMDITISVLLGMVSLVFYPFVYLAIKIEDGGPIFVKQKRVGEKGKFINIIKFRSMTTGSDWFDHGKKITKVGNFLRKSNIDELPQIWSILKGDQSLIGPRPELPELVDLYNKEISYYKIRHLKKPGLSGWAQIYHENPPHHSTDIKRTREKLSYDLFYIKNCSFLLDFKIALKTIRILLSRMAGKSKV